MMPPALTRIGAVIQQKRRMLARFCMAAGLAIAMAASPAAAGSRDPDSSVAAVRLFQEALSQIEAYALHPAEPMAMVETALRQYLKTADPYAEYLTADEFAAFRSPPTDARFSGISMGLGREASGRVFCIPDPGGAAEQAGIAYGDILVNVDGAPVAGLSAYQAGLRIRGRAGTPTVLTLQGKDGMERTIRLLRRQHPLKSVFTMDAGPFAIIRIPRFIQSTPRELKQALLAGPDDANARIIDLTGNMGGDLDAAMASAALFLPEGSPILTVKSRDGLQRHVCDGSPSDLESRLFLWQDARTASAAEVFIAALVLNGRAVSIGERSFGKGVAQRVLEMHDRSALILTYAALYPPSGRSFHGSGLSPLVPLAARGRDAYVHATHRQLAQSGD